MEYVQSMLLFQKDTLGALKHLHDKFQSIASFPWPMNTVLIFEPNYIRRVLKENSQNYTKGTQTDQLRPVMGNGIATNNDFKDWSQNRRVVGREFSRSAIKTYIPKMEQESQKLIEKLKQKSEKVKVDICWEMKNLSFGIVGQTLFGNSLSKEDGRVIHDAVDFTSIITYDYARAFTSSGSDSSLSRSSGLGEVNGWCSA